MTGPPAPARQLPLAGTPAQPRFAPSQEKISGTEVRRTLDEMTNQSVMVMFVIVVICIIILTFGHIHMERFVTVVIFIKISVHNVNVRRCQFFGHVHRFWSYSFGHLDSK